MTSARGDLEEYDYDLIFHLIYIINTSKYREGSVTRNNIENLILSLIQTEPTFTCTKKILKEACLTYENPDDSKNKEHRYKLKDETIFTLMDYYPKDVEKLDFIDDVYKKGYASRP